MELLRSQSLTTEVLNLWGGFEPFWEFGKSYRPSPQRNAHTHKILHVISEYSQTLSNLSRDSEVFELEPLLENTDNHFLLYTPQFKSF